MARLLEEMKQFSSRKLTLLESARRLGTAELGQSGLILDAWSCCLGRATHL